MEERLARLEEGQIALREQVAKLNGEIGQMGKCLDDFGKRLDGIEAEVKELRGRF